MLLSKIVGGLFPTQIDFRPSSAVATNIEGLNLHVRPLTHITAMQPS
jgi:hypothetical protein